MKKNKLLIILLLVLSVFISACTEKKNPTSQFERSQPAQNKSGNKHFKITYLKIKADFTRRVDKGFTIVTLDQKTRNEREFNNDSYVNVELMGQPNLHPSGEKVITHIRKYDGAPRTIVEIELESGEVRKLPNIVPQSLLPRYSPKGDRIAYHDPMNEDNHSRIVVYDIDEEKGEYLPCDGSSCSQPDWHPDGTKIAYVEDKEKLIEYDLINRTQVTRYTLKKSQSDSKIVNPNYSPDGKSILFLESKKKSIAFSNYRKQDVRKLIKLDKNNKATVVYERKGITGVEWCPDNKHIIYTAFNLSDKKNLNEIHLLKLGEKNPKIIKSFDQKHIKAAAYCR